MNSKTLRRLRRERWIDRPRIAAITLATALAATGAVNFPAAAQCTYEVTAIIKGPGDDSSIFANSVNDEGQVVGSFSSPYGNDRPFLWNDGQFIILQLPDGVVKGVCHDINNAGQIAGTMGGYWTTTQAFYYDGGEMIGLGTLPGGTYSEGLAISDDGSMVIGYWGNGVTGEPGREAFIWQDLVMTGLGEMLGMPESQARDINSEGEITGYRGESIATDARAYVLSGDSFTELDAVQGGFTSEGWGLNNVGDVAGHGLIDDPDIGLKWRAFFWSDGVMSDLVPPPEYEDSRAYAVGEDGLVVGRCYNGGGLENLALIWQEGVRADLNDLIPPDSGISNLSSAQDINCTGQIITMASDVAGNSVAVLLSPVEPPVADLTGDCIVDVLDLMVLLEQWGIGESEADFDGDGVVDVIDLLFLLAAWG